MRYQTLITSVATLFAFGCFSNVQPTPANDNNDLSIISNTETSTVTAQKNSGVNFICREGYDAQTGKEQYTTYAWTPEGKRAIIRWVKSWHNSGTWTPQTRCQTVSEKFQEAYNNGSLQYIANGWQNNQPVICTARQKGGDCVTTLMTLRTEDDPIVVTKDMVELLNGRGTGVIRHSSSDAKLQQYYQIDFQKFLEVAPIE
ncbi:MAG: COP23 domain-containing protein [Crocosphaera sp.]|nr:COP23 domain-containing protein [Crocosphaera sp.]